MAAIIETALDVAKAMVHMHAASVLHSDLKVCTDAVEHCVQRLAAQDAFTHGRAGSAAWPEHKGLPATTTAII